MFTVLVADNFHGPGDEPYRLGQYPTWEGAVAAARGVVDRCLEEAYRPGVGADGLFAAYRMFGDDPFVVPVPEGEAFSAWGYARARCDQLCGPGGPADREGNG